MILVFRRNLLTHVGVYLLCPIGSRYGRKQSVVEIYHISTAAPVGILVRLRAFYATFVGKLLLHLMLQQSRVGVSEPVYALFLIADYQRVPVS